MYTVQAKLRWRKSNTCGQMWMRGCQFLFFATCVAWQYVSLGSVYTKLFWAFLVFSKSRHWKSSILLGWEDGIRPPPWHRFTIFLEKMSLEQFLLTSTPPLCYSVTWFQNDMSTYEFRSPNTLWLQKVQVKSSLHLQPTNRTSSSSSSPGFGERNPNSTKYIQVLHSIIAAWT